MATIPRVFLTTSKSGLASTEPKNGQFIIIWDADEAYYDAPDDGTPTGTPVRRKISGVRIITDLPASPMTDIIYAYLPSGSDPDLRIWDGSDWAIVGNVTPDTKVQTDTSNGKFYLTGATSISDAAVSTLYKNSHVYVDGGDLYVKDGDLYVKDGDNRGVIHANLDGNASTATSATTATTANTATRAVTDNATIPHNITSYLHDVDINSGTNELIFTLGDGETTIAIQIPNTTYGIFDDLHDGLVPKTGSSVTAPDKILIGTGWEDKSNVSVGVATNATNATNDGAGNLIAGTYYADVDYVTGTGLTLTSKNGLTSKTIQLPISDYAVFTPSADGLVPKPSSAGETSKFLKGDGTWDAVPVPTYQGATAIAAGVAGLVPAASAGHTTDFLRGDATWGGTFDTNEPGLVPTPSVADVSYSLRANGTWVQSASTDTRDTTGASQVQYNFGEQDTFVGDGTTTSFTLTKATLLTTSVNITAITIDGVPIVSGYIFDDTTNTVIFDTAPADTLQIVITYTINETNKLYLVGSKLQDGGNDSPVTYTDIGMFLLNNNLYVNNNEIIDTVSYQDMTNKTFSGKALADAAFVNTSDTIVLTNKTINDEFVGDGTTVDYTINLNNPNGGVVELTSVKINGVTQTEGTDYTYTPESGDDPATVTFTTAPALPSYDLLATEPADWSTNFEDYFTKDGDEYFPVEGVAQYTSNNNPDWDSVSDNIWKYENSTYIQLTEKPLDWDLNYTNYFTQSIIAPTFAVDTYYEYTPSVIVITYVAPDPDYSTENVPTNYAVQTYIGGRIGSVQSDLAKRVPIASVAPDYNATSQDTFTGDGTTTDFEFTGVASSIVTVTIDGEEVTSGYTLDDADNEISFTTAPDLDAAIVVTYTTAYNVGDYVMYNDGTIVKLYRCKVAITTAELFDPTHWDEVIITKLTDYLNAEGVEYDNTTSGLTATDTQDAIDEVVSMLNYTSTEKQVGTWTGGEPLYEQTITLLNMTAGTAQTVAHSISADMIFIKEGFTEYTVTNDKYYGMISCYNSTAADEELCIKIDPTNITYLAGTALANAEAYITVRYTKPTI